MSKHSDNNYDNLFATASDFFKNEHTRWHTWTLLYLGVIGSIFLSIDKLKEFGFFDGSDIIKSIPFLFAALASILWLFTILNIAASTKAWHHTLMDMDPINPQFNPFVYQYSKVEEFDRYRFFWSSFCMMHHSDLKRAGGCRFWFSRSVTRTLLVFSTMMTWIFMSIFFAQVSQQEYIVKIVRRVYTFNAISSECALMRSFFVLFLLFMIIGIREKFYDCRKRYCHCTNKCRIKYLFECSVSDNKQF